MKRCISKSLMSCLVLGVLTLTSCAYHNVMLADVITFSDDAKTSYSYENKFFNLIKKQSDPYVIYGTTTAFGKEKDATNYLKNLKDRAPQSFDEIMAYNKSEYVRLQKKVSNIPEGKQTAGLYALDLGLDRVKYVRTKILRRDKSTKFYIIYLTDGLDNISYDLAKSKKQVYFSSKEKYPEQINKKKLKVMGWCGKQQCFQIFPMAFIGHDMQKIQEDNNWTEKQLKEYLEKELSKFGGASKGWEIPKPILASSFEDLSDQFEELFTSAAYDFYIPKGYLNEEIRMTLRNAVDDSIVVKGVFTKKMNNYYLENVTIEGYEKVGKKRLDLVATEGSTMVVQIPLLLATNCENKDDLISWFSISGLKKREKAAGEYKGVKVTSATQHHNEEGRWIYNSEYDSEAKKNANTYFMFIADGSSSLGDQRKNEQFMLVELLEKIRNTFVKK